MKAGISNRDNLHVNLVYDHKLPKLYLLSKGDRIDARFVSANAKRGQTIQKSRHLWRNPSWTRYIKTNPSRRDFCSTGISENLQEAFSTAYEQDASCRRFVSLEAARRYLDMVELKVFRQGEKRFCNFYADALSEMIDARVKEKELIIVKEGEIGWYQVKTDTKGVTYLAVQKREYIDWYQEKAAQEGMPFSLYLIEEMAETFLADHDNAYRVIQIYDKALQEELVHYMSAMEYQAKRYRRNLGYQD